MTDDAPRQAATWIEQLQEDILTVEKELRGLVRRHHYDPPPYGQDRATVSGKNSGGITISANQARTLLRAAMPVPIATSARRPQHARMVAALHTFATTLLALNDPLGGENTIAGALSLAAELRSWTQEARWQQATSAAGVAWKKPLDARSKLPISTVMQQSTAEPVLPLFDQPPPAAEDGRKSRWHKTAATATGQREILLPIAGRTRSTIPAPQPKPAPAAPPGLAAEKAQLRRTG